MDDHPPRDDRDRPLDAEPDLPPRSFSRAARRAAAPPPPDVPDFPFAFRELRRLTLEAETQFRWDSQQATWSQCAEHWRRRVQDMQPGDGDLDARLSRMLLGASTAAKPKHAPFFEASRVFQNKHVSSEARFGFWFFGFRETTFPLLLSNAPPRPESAATARTTTHAVSPRVSPRVVVVADFEASLKIDAQNPTWIDTQRQSWTEDVRDLGARVPFPLTPAQATRRAARFLDRLVASALPEAMKQAREGGWTARGFELWQDRLMRVSLICENEVLRGDQEGRPEDAREARRILVGGDETLGSGFGMRPVRASLAESVSRICSETADAGGRDRASSRRSTLAALGVSPPRAPRERRGGGAPAGLGLRTEARRRAEDVGREVAEALRASGLTRGPDGANATAERLYALRQDENYQALVTLYRDRMRTGQMPRGVYSGPGRDASRRLEQTREDPERDALIAATVSNMMRRGQVVTRRDAQTLAASHGLAAPPGPETRAERERESEGSPSFLSPRAPENEDAGFETPDGSPRSLLPRAPENEDAHSLDDTDPESEDAFTAGGEPPRAARVLRTLEDAEHFFATLPPGAEGHLLVPGTSGASGERARRARAPRAGDATREIPPSDDGDFSSDPDEDSPNPRRVVEAEAARGVGDVLRNVATGDAGPRSPGPECPPRERVDAVRDEAVVVDGAPVTCPAQFAETLAAARRAAADADAAAENARDAVTCQICYVQRRDALVMPCCHLLYCYRCVTRASEVAEARGHPDRCPCCRGPISGVLRCKLTE